MRLLLITNLYPPQELGGYGRSMADFAWGLRELGHSVEVVCSDAPYLKKKSNQFEPTTHRQLQLKGSFQKGVSHILDPFERKKIDLHNQTILKNMLGKYHWDGILIGNLDLIEHEILGILTKTGLPIIHHIGFTSPPFDPIYLPKEKNYKVVSASKAVKESLISLGFAQKNSPVIYPGARVELFGKKATSRELPKLPTGSINNPICIAYAGLLMTTKGLHILIEAIIKLKYKGISTRTLIAGAEFQSGYRKDLEAFLSTHNMKHSVSFTGELNRNQLARFFRLNHVFVFPSIYPEAFGIVQAEAMASGLALISSGVGGSKELVEQGVNGLLFQQGNSDDLSKQLSCLVDKPRLIKEFGDRGKEIAEEKFSVIASARKLEILFQK